VPTATDERIEEICEKIRLLCRRPLSEETETELRRLARMLRVAISHHVTIARTNLGTKRSAIAMRDPIEQ